ncbi:MAG: hypothetical protein ACJ0GH_01980 [Alphaproteobacteria bacterium]
MGIFNLYNKTKLNINKSSFTRKKAISFKAYEILKRLIVSGEVTPDKLDVAYPKNTKFKILKNVSHRSMKTFYKLSDKYFPDRQGVVSQIHNKSIVSKKKLSSKAKILLSQIKSDSPRYTNIDQLIEKINNK